MVSKSTNVIIIGAGPAGIACAIQLKRYNIDSIIFEKDDIGGLLKNANLVENYPGFPDGIRGKKFVQLLKKQSQSNKLDVKYEIVESVEFLGDTFSINTNKNIYNSKYLVIASGTRPVVPEVPFIQDSIKSKVFFEIYKLGQIKNKNIAIIGAGDCAFDYALNLGNNNKVIILNRSNLIKAMPILQDRVSKVENIKYFDNTIVQKIGTIDKQLNLILKNNDKSILVDYLLIAIGRKPNLDFICKTLLKNPKVFQIGDVKNGQFRQTSIAVGNGTFTAMNIDKILNQGD
ncbi:MAG: NAD(P)/FAD-dependent oxidoreductase [Candidatus Marinimicrobia bacterium]|nr:NAD(P)/FAD-dependent oxidoreductase [Candidatus Neomarinimicrobiota bacterium]